MTVPYSNREIDSKLDGIHEKLDLILDQTTKTNGRVTTLEMWREGTTGKFWGAMAVVSVLWGLILKYIN